MIVSVSEIAITFQSDLTSPLFVSVNDDEKLSLDNCGANKVQKVSFILVVIKRGYVLSTLFLLFTNKYIEIKLTRFCHF